MKILQHIKNQKLKFESVSFLKMPFQSFLKPFEFIGKGQNREAMILEDNFEKIVGTLQPSFLQHLTYHGGIQAQIEQVCI